MNRNIPIGNKICATKEIFQNQVILNQHLLTMRPQINTSAPKQYDFLKSKKIKEAIKQQKQQEIDRENQNLISKLTNIMQPSQNNSISTLPINKTSTLNFVPKKSLNKDHRKKELIKIVMENQQLLKRIQDQKSQYNVKDWNEERKWVEQHIANISEYPYKNFKPTKTLVQYWTNSRISESQLQKRENCINRKLDPLIESKSQQTKQRTRQENNVESRQLLYYQDFQQRQSLFESDFQPYEPYQDKVSKIVNELIEKPQHTEEKVENNQQINQQQEKSIQEQDEQIQQKNIESNQQQNEQIDNKEQEQINQDTINKDQSQNIQQNSQRKTNDEANQQENQPLNQIHQNNQEIQTIDFEQQNDERQDQKDSQEIQE
ncbi:unnamed protein product [Paramecium primaurelia]|uniref:Uncharacterized protein n=1 Tax=Paramecium primaurelia TaxID=5886 RepID=A0A8S1KUC4_PARPR|nr:unnamed protein product [Paramecium primaurelia]